MKKLNILGMATLIAANATSQELIKTKPKLDKKDEMASITKKKINPQKIQKRLKLKKIQLKRILTKRKK
ncbi:hypothetical protein BCB68_10310 [Leptotrichia sp. oral taxon 498]|uniref:hypothetical protein n=1 Tax=Leptotrichia sp. oral taxon 498 TaxID=712368 RepID=UPI000B8CB20B|nr:hypothetical protein [Leptotrichia sp. oral taxon 498]ASQ49273.1 hypothetical protein BCB68_10310 [Leptotrichia sp. oral taxon 498]